jgi:GNAT superfamily N-acetyltransferase
MLVLRPQWENTTRLVEVIDTQLRPAGYRMVGVFTDAEPSAVAVAGFRIVTSLAWDRYLYIDDVSTLPTHRGHGHADRLLTWLEEEGYRLECAAVHLDSGVGPDRAPAHRLYMRHQMRISAHHFECPLGRHQK